MELLSFRKMAYAFLLVCIVLGALAPFRACAQKVMERSEKLRPAWLANRTPKTSNPTFHYQITEGEHQHLEDARHSCLLNLSTYIKRKHHISEQAVAQISLEQVDGKSAESESYHFSYDIQGDRVTVISFKYDEYWEYVLYPDGNGYIGVMLSMELRIMRLRLSTVYRSVGNTGREGLPGR